MAICVICGKVFKGRRRDARYCSDAHRQLAFRAREKLPSLDDLDAAIEAARLEYWRLIALKARATGRTAGSVLTEEAVLVDERGNVWRHAMDCEREPLFVGQAAPPRAGWAGWGIEAAGTPHDPPPPGSEASKRVSRMERASRRRARLDAAAK